MRTLLRAAVLVLWVGVMTALYLRESPPGPSPDGTELPMAELPANASESWQGIYRGETKIGWARRRRIPIDDGFRFESEAQMRLRMMEIPQVVRTRVNASTDRRLQLRDFDFSVRSGTIEFEARGVVHDDVLEVTVGPEGSESATRIPLSGPIVLPQTLHEVLAQESLVTGRSFRYALFDPLRGEPAPIELEVGERQTIETGVGELEAYEVTQKFRGSTVRLWVSPEGEVLREEGPLGLILVRELRSQAMVGLDRGEGLDLTAMAAIPTDRAIPDPRGLRHLTLRLVRTPAGFEAAFPPRQTLDEGTLRIRREKAASIGTYVLPADAPGLEAYLQPTPFLQSDDPAIRKLAREIVGDTTDARETARRLVDWVYGDLRKVPTAAVPTALQVLESREGDCNEHAVLAAALARSLGLPARVVAGAAYMPADGGVAGAFYYHAWVELWLGEWVAADPTFGQLPADATHVKLLEGGPERHADLVSVIGQLEVAVEDFG